MASPPKIDFARITFPSDELTLKTLRRVHPDKIDAEQLPTFFTDRNRRDSADELLTNLLYCERALAEMAFTDCLGLPPADPLGIEGFSEALTTIYVRYGIASGQHHAEQLIRDFEDQAVKQARQHGRSHR